MELTCLLLRVSSFCLRDIYNQGLNVYELRSGTNLYTVRTVHGNASATLLASVEKKKRKGRHSPAIPTSPIRIHPSTIHLPVPNTQAAVQSLPQTPPTRRRPPPPCL